MPNALCTPCQELGNTRMAAVIIDAVPVCVKHAHGDSKETTGRYVNEDADVIPVPEPRLPRRAPIMPMHYSPDDFDNRFLPPKERRLVMPKPAQVRKSLFFAPELLSEHKTERISDPVVSLILHEVAAALELTMNDYLVVSNRAHYVLMRHMAIWLIRKHTAISYPSIGRLMGMHHTSAINAEQSMQRRMDADSELRLFTQRVWSTVQAKNIPAATVQFQHTQWALQQEFAHSQVCADMQAVRGLMEGSVTA